MSICFLEGNKCSKGYHKWFPIGIVLAKSRFADLINRFAKKKKRIHNVIFPINPIMVTG